ncbi:MAG: HEAT repeat domain-containing protein [Pyrinomonadaceae bacterium]
MFFAVQISAQNLEILAGQIRNGNTEQKREALFQIRNFQTEEASRIAVAALRDTDEIVRATAAFSVIYLPKSEAAQVLIPNLQDKSEIVRRETAYALGKVGDASAVNSLFQMLNKDKVFEVRTASAVAVGEIGDISAIGELIKILQKKPKEDEEFLRRAVARSIGQIAQIVQTNDETVLTPENFLPDKYKDLKQPKYLYIEKQFPIFNQAANVLKNVLQNKNETNDTRREAAFSLGAIGDASAVSLLQTKLTDKDYYLAEIAEEALRKIEFLQMLRKNSN